MSQKGKITAALSIALALLIYLVFAFAMQNQHLDSGAEVKYESPRAMSSDAIGGSFELIDEDGAVFKDTDLKRPYRLIYFGFTYCPAICPTELSKTIRAFNQLSEAQQEQIDLVFISIDPERDTPKVMKDYTDLFHSRLIGLTGSVEQIQKVLSDHKVYAAKSKDETMSDYTMDHSSYIYLFGADNMIRAMYRLKDEADFIAKDLPHVID